MRIGVEHAKRCRPAAGVRRRGSAYLMVLGTAMLVSLLGLSAMVLTRVERRADAAVQDAARARLLAQSAVELAMQRIADHGTWRTGHVSGVWTADIPLGDGTISYRLVDEIDGNLASSTGAPVVLDGRGRYGVATRYVRVTLAPVEPTAVPEAMRPVPGSWSQLVE
jgi:hypothetical protein